jgi:hypothetical protein
MERDACAFAAQKCSNLSATYLVIAGLDPAIQHFRRRMDHRVSPLSRGPLRAGPVMTPRGGFRLWACAIASVYRLDSQSIFPPLRTFMFIVRGC